MIGQYNNSVQFGQSRVLLVWNRLIFPNGHSIVLERQPGADVEGYAGLQDGVDYHWWELAKAAGLSTLLSVGAELATNDDDRLIQAIRNGRQDTINDAGQQIVRRQLNVAPTLTIRPGFPVRVIVTRDPVLEPYGGQPMGKPKLGPLEDDKPVKISVELAPALHRDLLAYAEVLGRESGQAVEPAKLVAPMIGRFMATDRGFAKLRRAARSHSLATGSAPPKGG